MPHMFILLLICGSCVFISYLEIVFKFYESKGNLVFTGLDLRSFVVMKLETEYCSVRSYNKLHVVRYAQKVLSEII